VTDCAAGVFGRVLGLEDLAAAHVAHAVAEEGGAADYGLFGAAGDVTFGVASVSQLPSQGWRVSYVLGINVQARNSASTKGTVMRYMPHFVHLYSGVFGSSDRANRPTKGGMQAAAMTYMRRLGTRRV